MIDTDTLTFGSFTLCETQSPNISLITFDLPELIENLRLSESYISGSLNSLVLQKSNIRKMVLTAVKKQTEIRSFQIDSMLTIELLEGRMKFKTIDESILLDKGQLLTVYKKIKYEMSALEETVFLLTIENEDQTVGR